MAMWCMCFLSLCTSLGVGGREVFSDFYILGMNVREWPLLLPLL